MTIDCRKNLQRVKCNGRQLGLTIALLTTTLLAATTLNSQASAQTQLPDSLPAIADADQPAAEMDQTLHRQTVSRGVTYLLEKGRRSGQPRKDSAVTQIPREFRASQRRHLCAQEQSTQLRNQRCGDVFASGQH